MVVHDCFVEGGDRDGGFLRTIVASQGRLMLKQKFIGVDYGPANILKSSRNVVTSLEVSDSRVAFGLVGQSA